MGGMDRVFLEKYGACLIGFIDGLEPSLVEKCSIYRQVFGNNLGFIEVPECSFVGKIVGHDHL
jgi:hypothetical protein